MSKNERALAAGSAAQPANATERRHRVASLINHGARLLQAGQPGAAIPPLQEALALEPDNVSAAINLGGAYVMAGKQRDAVPILERAVQLEPENPMVWVNLAAALLDRPPYLTSTGEERAIRAYERALELDPHSPNVSYNLGLIYKDRGELERAIEHFVEAVRTNAGDDDARKWIAALRFELLRRAAGDEPNGPGDVPTDD